MRTITPILILSLFSLSIQAQYVVNGSFEDWVSTPQFTLDPVGWETDNSQLITSTSQDPESYEGEWAMKVVPLQLGVGEYGEASTTVAMSGIPDGLSFYSKWWKTPTAAVGVQVEFFYEADLLHTEYWTPTDTVSDWTYTQMSFPPIDIALTHAIIRVFVAIGDFAPGDGSISVDAMGFSQPNLLDEQVVEDIVLYPNPAQDELILDVKAEQDYAIVDASGRTVQEGRSYGNIALTDLPWGRYTLVLLTEDGLRSTQSFVIQR